MRHGGYDDGPVDAHYDPGEDSGGQDSEGEATPAANQTPIPTQRRGQIDLRKHTPTSILLAIIENKVDFSNRSSTNTTDFVSFNKPWFERQARNSDIFDYTEGILHTLAGGWVPSEIQKKALWKAYWNDQNLRHFLVWLSEKYPVEGNRGFFLQYIEEEATERKRYPLGIALESRHDAFVQAILSLDTSILEIVLKQQHLGQRYVQLATTLNSSLLEKIIQAYGTCNLNVWEREESERSPLHVLMERVYNPSGLRSTDSANSGKSASTTTAEIYNQWKDNCIKSAADDAEKSKNARRTSAASIQEISGALRGDGVQDSSGTSGTAGTQMSNGVPAAGVHQSSNRRFEPSLARRVTGRMEQETKDAGETSGARRRSIVSGSNMAGGPRNDQGLTKARRTSVSLDNIDLNESHGDTQGQSANPPGGNTRDTKNANDVISVGWKDVSELLVDLAKDYQKPLKDGSSSQIARFELFVKHCKESLWHPATYKKEQAKGELKKVSRTPYQTRLDALQKAWTNLVDFLKNEKFVFLPITDGSEEQAIRQVVIDDPLADAVRQYCVRSLKEKQIERSDIMRSLYHPGDERHLDFDLAWFRRSSISRKFLDDLKHLQFECILLYVALPKLERIKLKEANETRKKSYKNQPHPQSQRTDDEAIPNLKPVFDFLRERGVKKIIRLSVVDHPSPSHGDSVIEECLKKFEVEEWDWKRVDLCTDVIANSTASAREISLYSSCNNAVLKYWASQEGLLNSGKFPKLQKVDLYISMGHEDAGQREIYLNLFKNKVGTRTYEDPDTKKLEFVKVTHEFDDGKLSQAAISERAKQSGQLELDWITKVQSFAKFLVKIVKDSEVEVSPVKIAIIDDGVDTSALTYLAKQNRIAGAQSFYPYTGSDRKSYVHPWYVPSGDHGTMMSDLICRICPPQICQLYIARLDERYSRSGWKGRQIALESAAEAVKWAMNCEVDIISMSWDVEKTSRNSSAGKKLEDELTKANDKHILMFCSSSDNGIFSSSGRTFYPHLSGKCIKIGAAAWDGHGCAWVDEDIDFLLPGKDIPFNWTSSEQMDPQDGSSLATALAAGLAGILQYAYKAFSPSMSALRSNEDDDKKLDIFKGQTPKKMSDMTEMFKNLTNGEKDAKYVQADRWFSVCFNNYIAHEKPDVQGRSGDDDPGSNKVSELGWTEENMAGLEALLQKIWQLTTKV